jgi:hypothetical protein
MADLDPGSGFSDLALLNPAYYASCHPQEGRLHLPVLLRAQLHPLQPVLLRELPPFLRTHLPLRLQVSLIPDYQYLELPACVQLYLSQPIDQVLERLSPLSVCRYLVMS